MATPSVTLTMNPVAVQRPHTGVEQAANECGKRQAAECLHSQRWIYSTIICLLPFNARYKMGRERSAAKQPESTEHYDKNRCDCAPMLPVLPRFQIPRVFHNSRILKSRVRRYDARLRDILCIQSEVTVSGLMDWDRPEVLVSVTNKRRRVQTWHHHGVQDGQNHASRWQFVSAATVIKCPRCAASALMPAHCRNGLHGTCYNSHYSPMQKQARGPLGRPSRLSIVLRADGLAWTRVRKSRWHQLSPDHIIDNSGT